MDRREFLSWVQGGLAGAAAASLLLRDGTLQAGVARRSEARRARTSRPRQRARIHICLCGAMSHVDTFDYKPGLIAAHGKSLNSSTKPDTSSARSAGCAGPTGDSASGGRAGSGSRTCFRTWPRWPTS